MAEHWYDIDYRLHFGICIVLSFFSTEAAIGASIGKEYGDSKAEGNHWCWRDLAADAVGIVVGTAARLLLIHKFYWL